MTEKETQIWIPVSEKLPREDEIVIVSVTDDSGDNEYRYTSCAWYYDGIWVINNERISSSFIEAWMPLPKPYKKGE